MSAEPQLFRINPENRESEKIAEVDFARLGFQERRDIQEWVAANPGILGEDLLIIGKEFSGFDKVNDRLDLLAVDADGKLVVIELKRDDTGADAHWQAIKYASYLRHADADDIVRMLADHQKVSEADALNRLLQYLNSDDLNALNNDQRIILASHRFAPEVTSAALWLNEKCSGEDLITCVQLTPYRDEENDSLYIQANTIIPVPGIDEYIIKPGDMSNGNPPVSPRPSKLARTFARNRNDHITPFLKGVADRAISSLPNHFKPDRRSRWAGSASDFRYYHLWYSRRHWGNWSMYYTIHLYPEDETESSAWRASVGFAYRRSEIENLESRIADLRIYDDQWFNGRWGELLVWREGSSLNDSFADTLADTIRRFIEVVTPRIEEIVDETNEEEA